MARMPMKMKKVIRRFRSPVKVRTWIETGSYQRGKWIKAASDEKNIDAIVLTLDPEQLQFYSVGNASKGAISIQTLETLYFCDVDSNDVEQKQSFVEWNGYKFRVVATGFTAPNSDFNNYIALKYTDYDANT